MVPDMARVKACHPSEKAEVILRPNPTFVKLASLRNLRGLCAGATIAWAQQIWYY
jgi:hypothetical protein